MERNNSWKNALNNIQELLHDFIKENEEILTAIKIIDKLDASQRELLRESVKSNNELAMEIQAEFEKIVGIVIRNDEFDLLAFHFQQECKILENISNTILIKENEILKQMKIKGKNCGLIQPETKPLLNERKSGDSRSSGGFEDLVVEEQKGNNPDINKKAKVDGENEEFFDTQKAVDSINKSASSVLKMQKNYECIRNTISEQNQTFEYEDFKENTKTEYTWKRNKNKENAISNKYFLIYTDL